MERIEDIGKEVYKLVNNLRYSLFFALLVEFAYLSGDETVSGLVWEKKTKLTFRVRGLPTCVFRRFCPGAGATQLCLSSQSDRYSVNIWCEMRLPMARTRTEPLRGSSPCDRRLGVSQPSILGRLSAHAFALGIHVAAVPELSSQDTKSDFSLL